MYTSVISLVFVSLSLSLPLIGIQVLREQLDLKRKKAVAALEEKKLAHTARVMREHERALKAIREYYVDVTHNNLEKIKALTNIATIKRPPPYALFLRACFSLALFTSLIFTKNQQELKGLVSARRTAEEGDLISIRKLARENKRMALPLKQANEDLYQLGEQLKEHEADKVGLYARGVSEREETKCLLQRKRKNERRQR